MSELYNEYSKRMLFPKTPIEVISTEKFVIIFNKKIGSRSVSSITKVPKYLLELNAYDLNITSHNRTIDFKEIEKEWNLILTKQSKKELIIVYRNPIQRLITGLLQDRLHSFIVTDENGDNDENPKLDMVDDVMILLRGLGYDYPKIESFKNELLNILTHKSDKVSNLTNLIFKKLLHLHIEHTIYQGELNNTHICPHNLPLFNLLSSGKLDMNKVILFDLDNSEDSNNYTNLLINNSDYNVNDFSNTSKNPNYFKELTLSVIDESFLDQSKLLLGGEVIAYHMLNNLKESIKNTKNQSKTNIITNEEYRDSIKGNG